MIEMKFLELSMDKVVLRFYAMMFGTLILGFLGYMTIAAVWGGCFALSSILGISIRVKK